jgi:hypothetical protein
MRMLNMVGTCVAALCVGGFALAQAPALPKAGNMQPAPAKPKALQNPPNITFKAPVFTGPALTQEQARKLSLIESWGLKVPVAAFQPSIWLTPVRPYVDDANNISEVFVGSRMPTTDYTAGAYGTITLPAAPASSITMSVGGGTPNTWWLVECIVSSPAPQPFSISTHPTTIHAGDQYPRAESVISRQVTPVDGRVAVLLEPTTSAVRKFIVTPGRPSTQWAFGGCELTPVKF